MSTVLGRCLFYTYHGDHTARPDTTVPSPHAHVVSIVAPPHEVLVSHVVGAVVDHEAAPLHPAGVAAVHVGGHVRAVAHTLIGAALEVPLLVEDNLAHHVHVAGGHVCQFLSLGRCCCCWWYCCCWS